MYFKINARHNAYLLQTPTYASPVDKNRFIPKAHAMITLTTTNNNYFKKFITQSLFLFIFPQVTSRIPLIACLFTSESKQSPFIAFGCCFPSLLMYHTCSFFFFIQAIDFFEKQVVCSVWCLVPWI